MFLESHIFLVRRWELVMKSLEELSWSRSLCMCYTWGELKNAPLFAPCLACTPLEFWGAGSSLGSSQVLLPDIIWIKFFVDRNNPVHRVSWYGCGHLFDVFPSSPNLGCVTPTVAGWVASFISVRFADPACCLRVSCVLSDVFWVPLLTSSWLLCQQHQTALRRVGHGYLEGCGAELSFAPLF